MPISDQVIELETKKKGRNIVFIVLISVLAAASIAFAVLWVTKAPAVDPPTIEKISVGSTDLSQVAGPDTSDESVPNYTVAPSCEYTISFDVVLKDNGYTLDDVNSVLQFYTAPSGMIEVLKTSGLDPENKQRYILNFRVNDAAQTGFRLIVSSEFGAGVQQELNFTLEKTYAEYFDVETTVITDTAGKITEVKALRGYKSNRRYTMTAVPDKCTETALYYKAEAMLPYYENPLGDSNEYYVLPLEQLGKLGINGQYAKVMKGSQVLETGGRFDQIRVYAADKANPSEGDWKEITDSVRGTENLQFDLKWLEPYCRNYLYFGARRAGTSTIRLVANAYNGAPVQYEVYLEIAFVSSNNLNKITQIVFTDPYTNKESSEVDLFLGDFNASKSFRLSDYISVKRGTVSGKAEWGSGKLMGFITDSAGHNVSPADSLIARNLNADAGALAIYPQNEKNTGVAYVTVRDSDTGGFNVYKTVKINIRPRIEGVGFTNALHNEARVATFSGESASVDLRYNVGNATAADIQKMLASFASGVSVEYNPNDGQADELTEPVFNQQGALTNRAKTIFITGLQRNFTLAPALTANGTAVTGKLQFTIGAEVPSGTYKIRFTLGPQALLPNPNEEDDRPYIAGETKSVTVVFSVTRIASVVKVNEEYSFEGVDSHTELFMNDGAQASATLVLAPGTGIAAGGSYHTAFSLKDILLYFEKASDTKPIPDTDDANYGNIKISADNDNLQAILNDSRQFIVPTTARGSQTLQITLNKYTLVLTVTYKYAVEQIAFEPDHMPPALGTDVSYLAPGSTGVSLGNGKTGQSKGNDKLQVRAKYDNADSSVLYVNELQHPELLQIDVVLNLGAGQYMLPKKTLNDGYTYFFPRATRDNPADMIAENAVFRMPGTPNGIGDFNIVLWKDLFALSVAGDEDYQNIRIYYSYGDTQDVFDLNDDYTIKKYNTRFAVYSDYNLIRKFDDFAVYNDPNRSENKEPYGERLPSGAVLSYTSGAKFRVYYSGIIDIPASNEFPDGKFIVEKDNTTRNLRVSGVTVSYNTANTHISMGDDGLFTVQCTTSEGIVDCGSVTYTEVGNSAHTAGVQISVTNSAVQVNKIELWKDAGHTQPLTAASLFTNGNGAKVLDIYYTVTYEPYDSGNTGLDAPVLSALNGFTVTSDTPFPSGASLETLIANAAANNLTLTGKVFVFNGHRRVSTSANTPNGDQTFFVTAQGNADKKASAVLNVTTVLDDLRATITDDAQKQVTIDSTQAKDVYFMYGTAANERQFALDFVPSNVDKRNLTYNAALAGDDTEGLSVWFFDGNGNRYRSPFTGADGKNIVGFAVGFGNRWLENVTLTVTVTDTANASREYVLSMILEIDVPVTALQLTVGGHAATNDAYTLVTPGFGGGETAYTLGAIINGGDEHKQPSQKTPQFAWKAGTPFEGVYRLSENTLYVTDNVTHAPDVTLRVTLNRCTVETVLKLVTTKLNFAFVAALPTDTVTNNEPLDFTAQVTNAGTGAEQDVTISYTCTHTGDLTVTETDGRVTFAGSNGTITVTATYTPAGGEPVTISHTVTVRLPVTAFTVTRGGNNVQGNVDTLIGKPETYTVTLSSPVAGQNPAVTDWTVTSSDTSVATVAPDTGTQNGTFTVTPVKSGKTTVTVSCDGKTFAFTVTVAAPALTLTHANGDTANEFDAFTADTFDVTLRLIQGGAYSYADLTAVTLTEESGAPVNVTPMANGVFRITILRGSLTAEHIDKTYTLTAGGTLNGVPLTAAAVFTLTANEADYVPTVTLTRTDGQNPNGEIDRAKSDAYTFTLTNLPTGFGESATVAFASDAFTPTAATGTGKTRSVQIAEWKSDFAGTSSKLTVSVALFDRTYERELPFAVVDSGAMEAALYAYDGNIDNMFTNEGAVNEDVQPLSGAYAIDYGTVETAKIITLTVEFTHAPAAVLQNAKASDFITQISVPSAVALYTETVKVIGGRHWYVAQYRALQPVTVKFAVRTAVLNGSSYAASEVTAEFTATEPTFSVPNGAVNLEPGASTPIQVAHAYAGSVTYTGKTVGGGRLLSYTVDNENNTVTVSAAKNMGGGSFTAEIEATLTNGAFAGKTYRMTVPVTVTHYEKPTVAVQKQTIFSPAYNGTIDFSDRFTVQNAKAYTVTLTQTDGIQGTWTNDAQNHTYAFTPQAANAENGLNFTVTYEVTATSDYYNNIVERGSITVVVAPKIGFTASSAVISAGGSTPLTVQVGLQSPSFSGSYTVAYTLSDPAAGTVANNVFTAASGFAGRVEITAVVTVTYSGVTELCEQKSVTVTVTGLQNKSHPLTAAPGGTLTFAPAQFAAGNIAFADTDTVTVTSSSANITTNNNTLTVKVDANYGTQNKTESVTVWITHGTTVFTGTFDVTITPVLEPELRVETTTQGKNSVYTLTGGGSANTYNCAVTSGAHLIDVSVSGNVITVKPKTNTEGGTAVLELQLTVGGTPYAGGKFAGTVLSQTVAVSVEKTAELPTLTATLENNTVVPNLQGYRGDVQYTYAVQSGSEYIRLSGTNNNVVTIVKHEKDAASAVILVTATLKGALFTDRTVTYPLTVPVPAAAVPQFTASANQTTRVITPSMQNATAVYTYAATGANKDYIRLNGNTYTFVTGAAGKTVQITVTATVTGGAYDGETYSETVTVTAPAMPVVANGEVTLGTVTNFAGTLNLSAADIAPIAYFANSPYMAVRPNGAYTLTPDSTDRTVAVTVYYRITGGAYQGEYGENSVNVVVEGIPAVTLALTGNKLTASQPQATLHITVDGEETATPETYLTLHTTNTASATEWTYTLTKAAAGKQIEAFVTATVHTETYGAQTVQSQAVSVPVPEFPALSVTATNNGTTADGGVFTVSENAEIIEYTYAGTAIVIDESAHTYTFGDGVTEGEEIALTVTVRITSGAYAEVTEEISVTVTVPAAPEEPEPAPGPSPEPGTETEPEESNDEHAA